MTQPDRVHGASLYLEVMMSHIQLGHFEALRSAAGIPHEVVVFEDALAIIPSNAGLATGGYGFGALGRKVALAAARKDLDRSLVRIAASDPLSTAEQATAGVLGVVIYPMGIIKSVRVRKVGWTRTFILEHTAGRTKLLLPRQLSPRLIAELLGPLLDERFQIDPTATS